MNHYYLHRFLAEEGEGFGARNHYTAPGDIGTLVNVAGAGVLRTSDSADVAEQLIDFLLGADAQRHFAEANAEYPLIAGVPASADLPSIAALEPPAIDLSGLEDLHGSAGAAAVGGNPAVAELWAAACAGRTSGLVTRPDFILCARDSPGLVPVPALAGGGALWLPAAGWDLPA